MKYSHRLRKSHQTSTLFALSARIAVSVCNRCPLMIGNYNILPSTAMPSPYIVTSVVYDWLLWHYLHEWPFEKLRKADMFIIFCSATCHYMCSRWNWSRLEMLLKNNKFVIIVCRHFNSFPFFILCFYIHEAGKYLVIPDGGHLSCRAFWVIKKELMCLSILDFMTECCQSLQRTKLIMTIMNGFNYWYCHMLYSTAKR